MTTRHSFVTRATHGAASLAIAFLTFSGVQILLHRHWIHNVARLHLYAGFLLVAAGAVYFPNALGTGELRRLLYRPADSRTIGAMIAYYLRLRPQPPTYDGYNPLQKFAYTLVLLCIAPLMAATGVMLWTKSGGRAVGIWHLTFAIELVGFIAGHVLMVCTTGFRQNIRSITVGEPAPQNRGNVERWIATMPQSSVPVPQVSTRRSFSVDRVARSR